MLQTQQLFDWGLLKLTSDRAYTIAKAIHQWQEKQVYHDGPRSDIDRPKKDIFRSPNKTALWPVSRPSHEGLTVGLHRVLLGLLRENNFDVHKTYAICPHSKQLNRKPHFKDVSSELVSVEHCS